MADTLRPEDSRPGAVAPERAAIKSLVHAVTSLRAADVQVYRICDEVSGLLLFAMLVFSPWAYGTTQPWSIWTMNVAGYALGWLLLAKLFIRQAKGYAPWRWDHYSRHAAAKRRRPSRLASLLTRALAGLTLALLAYCLISALNARSTYNPDTRLFEYHPCLKWLPHSLDSRRTWFAFWMYLGLAGSFWAVRDWLLGMTTDEERSACGRAAGEVDRPSPLLPSRLRWLLWALCLNGVWLGVEGIVQRAAGSGKLLFLQETHINREALDQFGPYAYRSNAAQYFNLLWPVCLGFWWTLHRESGYRLRSHHALLLCAAVMAACPIISASREGALVSAGMLVVAVIFLAAKEFAASAARPGGRGARRSVAILLALFLVLVLALGGFFGWNTLAPRLAELKAGYQNREAMYDAARPMAADYPVFGTGPGTFGTVFQLYLISPQTYWPEQLHNDWLETRITFGGLGLWLLLAALACVLLRRFAPGGIRMSRRLVALIWLALAGCFLEARFDFPFQIHSVLFLFLVLCAILFSLGGRLRESRR